MNKRLQEIFKKNAEFEKESPYNFCDRWCERCVHEKQIRCTLYKDELERKMTCIAHGRDEDDPEITELVMEAQYKEIDEKLKERIDKFNIDLDDPDIGELNEENEIDFENLPENIQRHIKYVENNLLDATAKNYCRGARVFLEGTFYKNEKVYFELKHDFETISWYHTLLPVKLHRALCGFHEPACEGGIALYDAVAQLQICKKANTESIKALRKIDKGIASCHKQISLLLALLHNIYDRIEAMENSI
jgi:hypothetical protein